MDASDKKRANMLRVNQKRKRKYIATRTVHSDKVKKLQNKVAYERRKYEKHVEEQVAQERVRGYESEEDLLWDSFDDHDDHDVKKRHLTLTLFNKACFKQYMASTAHQ